MGTLASVAKAALTRPIKTGDNEFGPLQRLLDPVDEADSYGPAPFAVFMEFETHVSDGQVKVKHIEGHTYVFKIGEGDLISDATYRSDPFGHGVEHFLTGAREAAQEAYVVSKSGDQP